MKKKKSVHNQKKVLVVGTTSDYIDWIRNARPGEAVFLTDPEIRNNADEPKPSAGEEILCSLDNFEKVNVSVLNHMSQWCQEIIGVACFDCESMTIAAMLANELNLTFPSLDAIWNCRDKYISKLIWQQNGIPCPETMPVNSSDDAIRFLLKTESSIVLKPFYGSGSELVFRCRTSSECEKSFEAIKQGLENRCLNPLFKKNSSQDHLMLAEEFILGPEYSCDFTIDKNKIRIIRMTKKIKTSKDPFGFVSGYVIPCNLPPNFDFSKLETLLLNGAKTLGIKRGICMVDFIMKDHSPFLIEMTPRPGGDCLPFLLKEAGGLDILGLTLDFAARKPIHLNGSVSFMPHVGLRITSPRAGILKGFNAELLRDEKRIRKIHFSKKPGHNITMPPMDYDSWILGHMIFKLDSNSYPETQSFLIGKRLQVEIE